MATRYENFFSFTIPWKWYEDRLPGSCLCRGPKVRNDRNYNWNHFFFCLRCILLFFIYKGNFKVQPEKIYPSQNANSHPKSRFDLSSYYINLLKNGLTSSAPPPLPSPREYVNYKVPLDRSMYIFNCNKTVEAIILKYL